MRNIQPSELKSILHSKRANIYYIEHCRVLVNGGRVEYVTEEGSKSLYWNIPIANTTSILLGTGTSITQSAVRELGKAGVLIGFCGGGGTPLFAANEVDFDVSWFSPQGEYRPTEYMQKWLHFWFTEKKRVQAAKKLQSIRLDQIEKCWLSPRIQRDQHFVVNAEQLKNQIETAKSSIYSSSDSTGLLLAEANLTKQLYKIACSAVRYGDFTRSKNGTGTDFANQFLDHGNYLAYGLGATATWVLGLPHGLSILHGKTRRGGLVFDAADLIKDALVLPQAFISAVAGDSEQQFRKRCLESFMRSEALDTIIDSLKLIANTNFEENL